MSYQEKSESSISSGERQEQLFILAKNLQKGTISPDEFKVIFETYDTKEDSAVWEIARSQLTLKHFFSSLIK